MSDEYFYKTNGMDVGPVPLAVIQQLIKDGTLKAGDQFRSLGGSWRDFAILLNRPETSNALPTVNAGRSNQAATDVKTPSPLLSPSKPSVEDAPWLFQTRRGIVGPITTEQFLEAAKHGVVNPQTLVQLKDSPEWMAAAEIQGLVFPMIESTAPSDSLSLTAPPVSRPLSNREMRDLFVECVSRQHASNTKLPPNPPRFSRLHLNLRWTEIFISGFSMVWEAVSRLFEWLLSTFGYVLRTRSVWASAVVLLVVLLIPKFSISLVTQREVYSSLDQTFSELKDLRSRNVDLSTWQEFKQRSIGRLNELEPQLEKKANSSDKASMSLLWIARDYLPRLLEDQRGASPETEQKIESHLEIVQHAIRQSSQSGEPWDVWTMAIVGMDVLGALAAVVYFGKKWWS